VKFIDEVTIEVASGKGGPGCVSFRREIFVPRGGPDGGDGGRGGDLIFKTSTRVHSLLDLKLKTKYRAEDGEPGRNQKRAGADAKDLVIIVPPGTIIKDLDGHILKDLGQDEEFVFLQGGIGGKGNPFYKSSVNQAPSVAQKGMPGKEATIKLELKLLADVGIIGFPNAGKSTLISHISSARPKVADYPFTTLIPNLGVVRYTDEHNFIVADMPGLIKGAHRGVGLGTRFLKHIERTKCFVHMVDASGMSGRDPFQDFKDINSELALYDKAHRSEEDFKPLASRHQIVALNKADVVAEDRMAELVKKFEKTGASVVVISAATGKNLKDLIHRMGEMVFNGEEEEFYEEKAIAQKGETSKKAGGKGAKKAGQKASASKAKKASKGASADKGVGRKKASAKKGARKKDDKKTRGTKALRRKK
jgi:GTP-binding protein